MTREEAKKTRIDQRPAVIERQERIGDWEGDTIVGERGTGSLTTHVDRASGYALIGRATHTDIYFAYPYHSWERGTNENMNGLIRQFFPKRTSFASLAEADTKRAERLLNTRPRKD